jgi:hypothetical protein
MSQSLKAGKVPVVGQLTIHDSGWRGHRRRSLARGAALRTAPAALTFKVTRYGVRSIARGAFRGVGQCREMHSDI